MTQSFMVKKAEPIRLRLEFYTVKNFLLSYASVCTREDYFRERPISQILQPSPGKKSLTGSLLLLRK